MINTKDIYWLAGLLEGEGSFGAMKYSQPRIQLRMGDRDSVERAVAIFALPLNIQVVQAKGNRIPQYDLKFSGRSAAAWMMTLYPLMSIRRKARIHEVVTAWKRTRQWRRKGCAKR